MIEYEGRLYRRHPRHANKNKYSTLNKITSIRVHPSMDGATKKNLDFKAPETKKDYIDQEAGKMYET